MVDSIIINVSQWMSKFKLNVFPLTHSQVAPLWKMLINLFSRWSPCTNIPCSSGDKNPGTVEVMGGGCILPIWLSDLRSMWERKIFVWRSTTWRRTTLNELAKSFNRTCTRLCFVLNGEKITTQGWPLSEGQWSHRIVHSLSSNWNSERLWFG